MGDWLLSTASYRIPYPLGWRPLGSRLLWVWFLLVRGKVGTLPGWCRLRPCQKAWPQEGRETEAEGRKEAIRDT